MCGIIWDVGVFVLGYCKVVSSPLTAHQSSVHWPRHPITRCLLSCPALIGARRACGSCDPKSWQRCREHRWLKCEVERKKRMGGYSVCVCVCVCVCVGLGLVDSGHCFQRLSRNKSEWRERGSKGGETEERADEWRLCAVVGHTVAHRNNH